MLDDGFSVLTYAFTGVGLLSPDFIGDGWMALLLRDAEDSDRLGDVNLDGVAFPADEDLRL